MAGPAPKPTALKVLAGNPGHRPLNDAEPMPELAMPKCPAHLSKEGKAEWKRLAAELHTLGLLTRIDRAALAAYCEVWARWVMAEKKLQAEGCTALTPNGYATKNAWLTIADKALEQMHRYLVEFGMTPASRSRVRADGAKKENEPSIADLLFAGVKADANKRE